MNNNISNSLSTKTYLIKTHHILIWFYENYKRIDNDPNKHNILTYFSLKYILLHLKKSTYYHTLNESTKRMITYPYFKRLFNDENLFENNYILSIYRTIDNKQIHKYHILKGWELKHENLATNTNINNNPID